MFQIQNSHLCQFRKPKAWDTVEFFTIWLELLGRFELYPICNTIALAIKGYQQSGETDINCVLAQRIFIQASEQFIKWFLVVAKTDSGFHIQIEYEIV